MKTLKFFVVLGLAVTLLSSCELYRMVRGATKFEEAHVVMKDGTEYEGRVCMPNCNTKKLRFKTPDGEKLKLQNTDVSFLAVWGKKHPDKYHVMMCHPYLTYSLFSTKKQKVIDPQWMSLEAQGDYVEFYYCGYDYTISRKGALVITSTSGASIILIAKKAGEEAGHVLGSTDSSKRSLRKQLVEFLSDDPVLSEKLKNKEIDPTDFQDIANMYNPTSLKK